MFSIFIPIAHLRLAGAERQQSILADKTKRVNIQDKTRKQQNILLVMVNSLSASPVIVEQKHQKDDKER